MQNNTNNNLGFKRKSGILMAVSSLPSKYGIGTFGAPCYRFIDFLDETGQTCWQILPLGPTAYGDSPYQSPSSFAGNPYFLDLDDFYARGLLNKDEIKAANHPLNKVDYGWLFNTRFDVLRKAFSRFKKTSAYYRFLKKNADWIGDYALFTALKVKNGYRAWTQWSDEYKDYKRAICHVDEVKDEVDFWQWVQYEFDTQWKKVRLYARKRHIRIIGDMPIYVASDSVDVWSKPENYLLNDDFTPKLVAGCPPDGFTPDGQLWGNPIYDWSKMKVEGFDWWIKRVKRNFELYDILRIDHFRGFAGYYVIPYGEPTARNGRWMAGPGKELFTKIKLEVPQAKIIAEDLGFYTPDVGELLEFTGYPGMKLLQFAFFDDDSENLPRMFKNSNCIVYTGSHDADCTYSWCKNLKGAALRRFKKECPVKEGETKTYALIRLAFSSKANLAIIPLQDYLELPNEKGRMNTPSTPEGNWTWRAANNYDDDRIKRKIKAVTFETKRNKKSR